MSQQAGDGGKANRDAEGARAAERRVHGLELRANISTLVLTLLLEAGVHVAEKHCAHDVEPDAENEAPKDEVDLACTVWPQSIGARTTQLISGKSSLF